MSARICECLSLNPLLIEEDAYPLLEHGDLFVRKSVGLGDDWNEVDLGMQPSHDLNIERLQRVASGLDEINASVDPVIDDVNTVHLILGVKISIEALLDIVGDGAP